MPTPADASDPKPQSFVACTQQVHKYGPRAIDRMPGDQDLSIPGVLQQIKMVVRLHFELLSYCQVMQRNVLSRCDWNHRNTGSWCC
jgi:hypothetical protein